MTVGDAARIVLELHSLFRALDQDERAEGNGGERAVVSPNGLREALAQRPDFQLGARRTCVDAKPKSMCW